MGGGAFPRRIGSAPDRLAASQSELGRRRERKREREGEREGEGEGRRKGGRQRELGSQKELFNFLCLAISSRKTFPPGVWGDLANEQGGRAAGYGHLRLREGARVQ